MGGGKGTTAKRGEGGPAFVGAYVYYGKRYYIALVTPPLGFQAGAVRATVLATAV